MSPIMRSIDSVLNLLLEFWNFYILKENWKNLKIMIMLLTGCIVGVICVIPYSLTIQKPILEKIVLPIPMAILIPLQIVQNAFIFLFLILVGLFAAHKAGLCVPAIDAWLTKKAFSLRKIFAISIPLGILAALLIIILDVFLFSPRMPPPAFGFERPPAWQGFLASFYGGIAEEVQLRLFLISLFVWGASKIRKGSWGSGFP